MTTQPTTTALEHLPLPERRKEGAREPRYYHGCEGCIFLGEYLDTSTPEGWPMDLYVHFDAEGEIEPLLMAQFGETGEGKMALYISHPTNIDKSAPGAVHPSLLEARRRLASRMLIESPPVDTEALERAFEESAQYRMQQDMDHEFWSFGQDAHDRWNVHLVYERHDYDTNSTERVSIAETERIVADEATARALATRCNREGKTPEHVAGEEVRA